MDISGQFSPAKRSARMRDLSPSIHWAQTVLLSVESGISPRRIYDFELLYLREGCIKLQLGAEQLEIHAGQLLLLGAGVPHSIQVLSGPAVSVMGVHFDFFDELDIGSDHDIVVDEADVCPERFCDEPLIEGFRLLSDQPVMNAMPEAVAGMENIIEQFGARQHGYELMCRGYMLQIIAQLFRWQGAERRSLHPVWGSRILQLAGWIEDHYAEECSNAVLARRLNVDEDYMAKQFKNVMGVPPQKFLQAIRHRVAKQWLRETDELVEVIGGRVGYSDSHYFSRMFRKLEGISPREYRQASRLLY